MQLLKPLIPSSVSFAGKPANTGGYAQSGNGRISRDKYLSKKGVDDPMLAKLNADIMQGDIRATNLPSKVSKKNKLLEIKQKAIGLYYSYVHQIENKDVQQKVAYKELLQKIKCREQVYQMLKTTKNTSFPGYPERFNYYAMQNGLDPKEAIDYVELEIKKGVNVFWKQPSP